MTTSSLDDRREGGQRKPSLFLFFGLLPVLLVFALVIGLWLFPPSVVVFEPYFLLSAFNTTLFLAAGLIAFIALRSYLITGASTIFWLGCGVWTLGLGALAAGWLIYPFGPNVNVTIFSVGALLASICHVLAVLASLEGHAGEVDPGRRKQQAWRGYMIVAAAMALLVVLTLTGIMPPFFIQGKGPTALRQYVVEWAIVLYIFAALAIMHRNLRKRAPFLYWYSLALALLALALVAFFLQPAVGSPIGWVGRSSYVLAAVYFLLSVNSAWREARTRGVGLSEALAELFGPGLHWQGIMATVSDAIVSYNEKGEILLWNKAAERIFGYPEAEVKGKGINLILPDMKPTGASDNWCGIREIEPTRQDGSRFKAEISVSATKSSVGAITTLVIRDITERKLAEEALAASRARFEAIFNSIGDAAIFVDRERRIALLNPATEAMFGYRPEELLGESTEILYADPADYEKLGRLRYHETAATNQPFIEIKYRRRDGTVFHAESVGRPVHDVHGHFLGSVGIHRDITERKRAEEALQDAKDRLQTLIQTSPAAIVALDNEGKITSWNPAAKMMFGWTAEEALGQTYEKLVVPEQHRQEFAAMLAQELKGRTLTGMELLRRRKDGSQIYISGSTAPLYDARGNLTGVVAVMENITDRKLAEEALRRLNEELEQRVEERTKELQETVAQLEEEMTDRQQAELEIKKLNEELEQRVKERTAELEFANRELEAFAYSVSHDLKAPTRAIQGFSKMLLEKHAGSLDAEGLRLFNVIVNNTQIMANLIDDLLALSRLGRHQIRKSSIDLAVMSRQVFKQLAEQEPERDLRLNVQDLPQAWGDPSLINQVMMNLLGNAIKYTRAKKTANVEVRGYIQGQETIYYVKDNGIGFDARYADKLFGVFQRLHGGPEYEGTGVGLAIVQRIIQRHGGRVWAEGKLGAGATFYFSLPK